MSKLILFGRDADGERNLIRRDLISSWQYVSRSSIFIRRQQALKRLNLIENNFVFNYYRNVY